MVFWLRTFIDSYLGPDLLIVCMVSDHWSGIISAIKDSPCITISKSLHAYYAYIQG